MYRTSIVTAIAVRSPAAQKKALAGRGNWPANAAVASTPHGGDMDVEHERRLF
jgi:hypothetical protein